MTYGSTLIPVGISSHMPNKTNDEINYSLHRCILEMYNLFHSTLYWTYAYLSTLGLKLIHVCKSGP